MQLRRYRFRLGKIHHIFISHIHGDHVFGLYGLLSTFSLLDRNTPLHLYAPAHFEGICHQHLADFDIHLPYELVFHPLDHRRSEQVYEDELLTVRTIPLRHRVPTCGFLFREKPRLPNIRKEMIDRYKLSLRDIVRIKAGSDLDLDNGTVIPNRDLTYSRHTPVSYAYCSDTAYNEQIVTLLKQVDVLFHEATYAASMSARARETFHSTAAEAAGLAAKAGAGQLILGHFSARYKDTSKLLEEALAIFPRTLAAEDGVTYRIQPHPGDSNE